MRFTIAVFVYFFEVQAMTSLTPSYPTVQRTSVNVLQKQNILFTSENKQKPIVCGQEIARIENRCESWLLLMLAGRCAKNEK